MCGKRARNLGPQALDFVNGDSKTDYPRSQKAHPIPLCCSDDKGGGVQVLATRIFKTRSFLSLEFNDMRIGLPTGPIFGEVQQAPVPGMRGGHLNF